MLKDECLKPTAGHVARLVRVQAYAVSNCQVPSSSVWLYASRRVCLRLARCGRTLLSFFFFIVFVAACDDGGEAGFYLCGLCSSTITPFPEGLVQNITVGADILSLRSVPSLHDDEWQRMIVLSGSSLLVETITTPTNTIMYLILSCAYA